ncbi:MAG TPA: hypothetical protein EYP49_00400 [Anaerolineae bacterium]|nr:hypothetical protein [Anaerolineae bacterium]
MTHYIEFTTENSGTILIEIDVDAELMPKGMIKAGLGERAHVAVTRVQTTFEDALEVIRCNAGAFIKKMRSLTDPPDEVEVAFGLKATGELGNFAVAKVGTEANYTVKLTWKRGGQATGASKS